MERLKQKLGLVDEQKRKTRMIEGNEESEGQEVIAWRMGLIAPNGPRKGKWDWFVLALCLYTSLSVPMGLGFYAFTDWGVSPAGFCFDIFVDVCFIVDLAVAFRTTYYNREGLLVMDKKLVARQYLKRWFWPDLLASFPFEHVATLITVGRDVTVPPSLRLPSMLKTLRVLRLGRKIDRLSSSKMFRIFQFTCMLLMAAHWYACLWFYMGGESRPVNNTINFSPGVDGTSWVYSQQIDDESRPFQYMMSFYWAITVLMKAPSFHPASPGEFAVAIIMIIIGCVLYAYFLGNVTAVISAANAAGGRYRGQIAALKSFCSGHGLNGKLSTQLLTYQDALWIETYGGTDRQFHFGRLPEHLLPEVVITMYKPLLDACPFLYDCSSAAVTHFLTRLKVRVIDRNDVLMRSGSMRTIMYILQRGEIKIDFQPDEAKETIEHYVPGGRIGSNKSKFENRMSKGKDSMRGRTDKMGTMLGFHDVFEHVTPVEYTVTALSRCSLLSITRNELRDIFSTFEADKEHFDAAVEKALVTIKGGNRRSVYHAASKRQNRGSSDEEDDSEAGSRSSSPDMKRKSATFAAPPVASDASPTSPPRRRSLRLSRQNTRDLDPRAQNTVAAVMSGV